MTDLAQLFAGGGNYEAYSDAPVVTGTFANSSSGRTQEANAQADLLARAGNPDMELTLLYP